jgi:putative ABC transport system substrate-binding protein
VNRREFVALIGGTAAWLTAARAQQSAMPMIGFLGTATPELWADRLRAFHQGLNEIGYVDGRNVKIEYRWAEDDNTRFPALVDDLVRRQPAVIVADSLAAALPAKAATKTIPIVFAMAADPVEIGLVSSLSRPGGNLTGATNLNLEILPKRLELLHELVPTATIFAVLANPTEPNAQSEVREQSLRSQRARSDCKFISCMPARNTISRSSLQNLESCEPADW